MAYSDNLFKVSIDTPQGTIDAWAGPSIPFRSLWKNPTPTAGAMW